MNTLSVTAKSKSDNDTTTPVLEEKPSTSHQSRKGNHLPLVALGLHVAISFCGGFALAGVKDLAEDRQVFWVNSQPAWTSQRGLR